MKIEQIALDKLVPAKAPVRHTNGAKGKSLIDQLAASILAEGLLQNLVVQPSGKKFQVLAGNHRLAALQQLTKTKASGFTGQTKIPCRVIPADDEAATAKVLAENLVREPLHFIDEAEAFADLVHQGMEPLAIANRFAWTDKKVRQMNALGQLPQPIRDSARAGEIGLDACKAYTLFGVDQPGKAGVEGGKRAFECWKTLRRQADANNSHMIRRVAREQTVPIKHALFDPTQHQDQIATDLFGADAAFRDQAKFWELQNAAIQAEAERLKAVGWSDVQVIRDPKARDAVWRDWDFLAGQLDTATEKKIAKLQAERDAIENREEWTDEEQARIVAIEAEQDKLRETNATWTDRQMKKRQALILVDERTGEVEIKLGALNRKDAEKAAAAKARKRQGDIEDKIEEDEDEKEEDGAPSATRVGGAAQSAGVDKSYPRNVVADLYAIKSLMLQDELATSPKAAVAFAIWSMAQRGKTVKLIEDPSRHHIGNDRNPAVSLSEIGKRARADRDLPMRLGLRQLYADDVRQSEADELDDPLDFQCDHLDGGADFIAGLMAMEFDALLKIFAAIVARGAGYDDGDPRGKVIGHARDNDAMNLLAAELQVNPRSWWTPSADFFARLPRKTLLEIAKGVFDKDFIEAWRGAKVGELAAAVATRWTWDGASEGEKARRDHWLPPALRVPLPPASTGMVDAGPADSAGISPSREASSAHQEAAQ